ncbi:MAG: hypothetical protein EWM73_01944 [Nitrospira sp.]|nr:MAG: hypothetical protein EWM73_01944 [Nitrospira sp.]
MLVYVRPSNEALLRARVPGAQDQRGCPSNPFHRARSASKEGNWPLPLHPSEAARCASTKGSLVALLSPCFRGSSRFFNNKTLKSMRPNQTGFATSCREET